MPMQHKYASMDLNDPPEEEAEVPPRPTTPLLIDFKKAPARQALVHALREKDKALGIEGGALTTIAMQLVDDACAGNAEAMRQIYDRLDGKPAQAMQVTGADGGPIEVNDMSKLETARRIAFLLHRGVDILNRNKQAQMAESKNLLLEQNDG